MTEAVKASILEGKTVLGIELGSTRIKAVLIGEDNLPIATGSHDWENSYLDNIWTYSTEEIWKGLRDSYQKLVTDVERQYNVKLSKLAAIGISAMMHGYLVFDHNDQLLVPFRTWRNNITGDAASELTTLFNYQIPQRWSITHLYQAILNEEPHVASIHFQTTLAGYVHWMLTGEKVLGVGEASGMFPIDLATKSFNKKMIEQFDQLVEGEDYNWQLSEILPAVKVAGEDAGRLTEAGAILLDPTGELQAGALLCPPEGDAGTGMVATNSVAQRTGNVSAGTSAFAMVVLEDELSKVYPEIDLVTTPTGSLVAMAHSNNCTSDLNAWLHLFKEYNQVMGIEVDTDTLYHTLFNKALEGDADAGGLLSYGYLSGEHMTHFESGRPLFARSTSSSFTLANFMRTHLYSAVAAMKMGMDILLKEEQVNLDEMHGHGGLFKTEGVGQQIMAAALNTPVAVLDTAGEGGAWGIAILAAYLINNDDGETLAQFLTSSVFGQQAAQTIRPDPRAVAGFEQFMERYQKGLPIERAAVELLS
ncbi:Sugar (pentulose or hexulose) kinase [Amphibacillus marinus]|uniref:Sugar (Pentulose or hexulose) kinase n=1 Tax=Amphibacillus marinus TaxID=872970 RepID=A0A1H8LPF8_9BACI|nr:FGGY-family carbohydrate kinase [Amphibacillus marinus]SEO07031.1 Sugar (pentulose or hexulose) kinase [Amphibacillus marinus]